MISNDLFIRCVLLGRVEVPVKIAGSAASDPVVSEPSNLYLYPPRSTVDVTPDARFQVDLRFETTDSNELTIKDPTCR